MKIKRLIIISLVFAALMSCRKLYDPPAISSPQSYLVVEGTINTSGITTIKLSRTVPLSSATVAPPLGGATVAIQSNQNTSYPLTEGPAGTYQSTALSLDNSQQYRLSINAPKGQQYLSASESPLITPPLDSVGYKITGSGLQLYVNAHDPTNNVKYYRWDYNETWQFHSLYYSAFITNGTAIVPRTQQQNIYTCFASDTASNILLANTAHLSQSVIYRNPLTTVASASEKVENEYTIQVNQYALSGDAYNFWNNLKNITENLGSIFDPQPSQINGNIHNASNSSEPVIGYVSVCPVQTKRIFIYSTQLPTSWAPVYPYECTVDSAYFVNPHTMVPQVQVELIPLNSAEIPLGPFYPPGSPFPAGYLASDQQCVDCTIRGTTTPPPFWQYQ